MTSPSSGATTSSTWKPLHVGVPLGFHAMGEIGGGVGRKPVGAKPLLMGMVHELETKYT